MYIQLYEIYKTASSITYTAHSTPYTRLNNNNASAGHNTDIDRMKLYTQHITHELAKKNVSLHLWALIKLAFLMLI